MNNSKFLFSIFLLIISYITCLDKRVIFAEKLRKMIQSLKKPVGSDDLVSGFQNKLTLLFYTLPKKELDGIKIKYDLSDSLMLQIRVAAYAKTSGIIQVNDKTEINYFSYEESIGAVLKENDDKFTFALIKTRSFAKLKPKYEKYYEKECHRTWIFFKSCHDIEKQRERELTHNERFIVGNATKYSAKNSVLEGVDILKKGDYELYMSDTGSIFSPDKKSVAHICYFGNIAIGPTSDLNVILPINYRYDFRDKGTNFGQMIKVIDDKVIQLKDYPININNTSYMIIKEGNFHKYNFIIKSQLTKFPGQYVKQMNKLANMGPFVLEVKKNGNVIYYQKNNPSKIMWQTNTANKGKGPYNFYLTNDKKLILEDSNGDILYKYDSYIDIPTINYGKGINGLFYKENDNNPINPKTFKITIDNKDLQIKWNLVKKTSPTSSFESPRTTVFTSNIIGNNQNIDICYSARIFEYQWTGFGCNGELVGARLNYIGPKKYVNATSDNIYITNLIIYIKPKNEDIPKINNSPKLMQFNVGY